MVVGFRNTVQQVNELGKGIKSLGSGHRVVDFDRNKKNCGPQNITQHQEKYRVRYFLHLSIIGMRHPCLHVDLMNVRSLQI